MVMVPVRWLVSVLADTEYFTVPFPLPLLPEVIVIQLTLLVAVQLHPLDVITLTLPLPPLEAKDLLVELIEYEQEFVVKDTSEPYDVPALFSATVL